MANESVRGETVVKHPVQWSLRVCCLCVFWDNRRLQSPFILTSFHPHTSPEQLCPLLVGRKVEWNQGGRGEIEDLVSRLR